MLCSVTRALLACLLLSCGFFVAGGPLEDLLLHQNTRARAVAVILHHVDKSNKHTFPTDPHPMDEEWLESEGNLLPKSIE